jgi:hypothetical protein
MFAATAQNSSSIRFRDSDTKFLFERPSADDDCETPAEPRPSDMELGAITGPTLLTANWLPIIERRICSSISAFESEDLQDDGRWLASEVAEQALMFFQTTSDVLPAVEPYMYTSAEGDLVVEFAAPRGKMTNIIGRASAVSFATVDGQIMKATLPLPVDDVRKARQELHQQTDQLYGGVHGVES